MRKNEKGNVTLFTLGSLTVIVLAFAMIYGASTVLTMKQKATTAAQQASLAASDEIVNGIIPIAESFSALDPLLKERYVKKYSEISAKKLDWGEGARKRKAWSEILAEGGFSPEMQTQLMESLPHSQARAEKKAEAIIKANGGKFQGIAWGKDGMQKVFVTASVDVGFQFVDKLLKEKRKFTIDSEAAGPDLPFINSIGSLTSTYNKLKHNGQPLF
ncbi:MULTISPECIES: pilus assembly protein TadG-related protein [unclassified Bacillus cereus group]|uniref:pilus assembly protein TadG-related protein n=1 Tax=unclassified Bacillus cereus group TaxID=2750818 RepID=UPI001F590AAE|nr:MULTISPECIES: pilus assembly protein TadG-related protein [unclassified Bacillus cereus group]